MTTEQIQQLINSLNSIGEIAFRAAIKQMYINGVFEFIIGTAIFVFVLYIFQKIKEYYTTKNDNENTICAWIILFVGTILFLLLIWHSVSNLTNPEYGALKSILSNIR